MIILFVNVENITMLERFKMFFSIVQVTFKKEAIFTPTLFKENFARSPMLNSVMESFNKLTVGNDPFF